MRQMAPSTIKRLRAEKGLSQADLAGWMCVTIRTVTRWETGESVPRAENMAWLWGWHRTCRGKRRK